MEEVLGSRRSENIRTTNNIRQRQVVGMETGPITDRNGTADEDLCTHAAPEMGYNLLEDWFLSVAGLCGDDPVLFPTDHWIDVKLHGRSYLVLFILCSVHFGIARLGHVSATLRDRTNKAI
jgi:hypothetical protein